MTTGDLGEFLSVRIPGKGYHAFNGEIELYSEKGLSFECGCGNTHSVKSSRAIIDFPVENKGLYVCPNNERLLVLVKATGVFSVKGLRTVVSYEATDATELQQILNELESRKRRGS